MSKLRAITVGVLLSFLLMSFSLLAKGPFSMILASDLTRLLYPGEFVALHSPFVNVLLEQMSLDYLKLPQHETKDLKNKLTELFLDYSKRTLAEARYELYSENELAELVMLYKSEMGKQIIQKMQNSKNARPVFNQQEVAFMNAFQESHEELAKKSHQLIPLYIQKLSPKSSEKTYNIGYEVAKIVSQHVDAYEKQNK